MGTNGGTWQHFYLRGSASETSQIDRGDNSKTLDVARLGENAIFARAYERCNVRLSQFGCPCFLMGLEHPLRYEIFKRVLQNNHHFSQFSPRYVCVEKAKNRKFGNLNNFDKQEQKHNLLHSLHKR